MPSETLPPLRVVDLEGEPYDMGRAHGEQFAADVHEFCELRIKLCEAGVAARGLSATRDDLLGLAKRFLEVQEKHVPDVHAEFCGIADGARISQEELLIGNGYTDFKDALHLVARPDEGCTSFLVKPAAGPARDTYLGQTWDMNAFALPFVIVLRRQPKSGPQTITLTTTGCLSLIGMNECGLAIGNNNLTPTDARPGLIYLAMIHDFLNQTTFDRAHAAVVKAQRASGHNYYMADAEGHVRNAETTAMRAVSVEPPTPVYAHANHYEAPTLRVWEASPPGKSSVARKRRLTALLNMHIQAIDAAVLMGYLSAGGEGDSAICRRDGDACTCAAAVMCPQERELHLCQGPPDQGRFVQVEFR